MLKNADQFAAMRWLSNTDPSFRESQRHAQFHALDPRPERTLPAVPLATGVDIRLQ